MPAAHAPDADLVSFASRARREAYIEAMHRIAEQRQPGKPVRVYVSVRPQIRDLKSWPTRLEALRKRLPRGIELLTYDTVFADPGAYARGWQDFARTLDGLVIIAMKKRQTPGQRVYRLGATARHELVDVVGAAKPVLLFAQKYGLVPVVDCRGRRIGPEHRPRTQLTIPEGWPRKETALTLRAALKALRPRREEPPPPESARSETEPSVDNAVQGHLWNPFNGQGVASVGR